MSISFGNINIHNSINYASSFGDKISNVIINLIIDKDNDKIGFFISSLFHLSIIIIAIGIPSCFQPSIINVPNIIPIEILNIDDVTRIPEELEKKEDSIKGESKKAEEVRFSSAEQTEIVKIQQEQEKLKDIDDETQEIFQTNQEEDKSSPIIKEKPLNKDIKYEAFPTKKIKPKIKPKPKIQIETDSDVVVKVKQKPKQSFNIASVLKDLRKEKIQTTTGVQKEEDESESMDKDSGEVANSLTISEIDLLKQQLYGCWTVPAGAKGAKDMEVKVRVWVNPDRTVSNARILDTNRMQNAPYFRTVAESALRAVLNPACNSLKLPPDKYEIWKKFIFKFELEWMLGN